MRTKMEKGRGTAVNLVPLSRCIPHKLRRDISQISKQGNQTKAKQVLQKVN